METLSFEFPSAGPAPRAGPALVGVVASGNLEVLVEFTAPNGLCRVVVSTSARGFGEIWEAVLRDFATRHSLSGLTLSVNDAGATPAVVSLRLDQAVEEYLGRP